MRGSVDRKRRAVLSTLLSIAIMVAIFMFSNQNSGDSGSLSEKVAFILASIFVDGFQNMSPLDQQDWLDFLSWPVRKTAHATEYGCLAISLVLSCWEIYLYRTEDKVTGDTLAGRVVSICIIAFAIAVLYACTDEVHQMFIDGRAGQFTDVLVDASGAIIGSILASIVAYAVMRKRTRAQSTS